MNVTAPIAMPRPTTERVLLNQVVSAVVFREVLAPLTARLGPVGDVALSSVTDRLFAPREAT